VIFVLLELYAPARRSKGILLDSLKVITTILCLAIAIDRSTNPHAANDATLAEFRAERWAGAYQSSMKEKHPILLRPSP